MQRNHNKLIHQHAPKISPSELSLPRETRRTLAQLRTNKIFSSHPYIIPTQSHAKHTTPPLSVPSAKHTHIPQTTFSTALHLYTSSNILDLGMSPERVAPPAGQVEETPCRASSRETKGCRTPPQLHAGGVGR